MTDKKGTDSNSMEGLRRYAVTANKGKILFEQGDEGKTMFFILDGQVRISKVIGDRIQPIAILEKGDFFGEMALLNDESRVARAETLTFCTLVELDRNTFQEFLRSNNEASIRMLLTLTKRLRQTDELVESLITGDPQAKVAASLLKMIRGVVKEPAGYPIRGDVNALMIASGTDSKLLRMVLSRFKGAGFVDIQDRAIFVRDRTRLQQYINFLRMKGDFFRKPQR